MKQSAIKRAQKRIEEIERGIEMVKKLPDGPFDFPVWINCTDDVVHVHLPFDLEAFKVFRKAMAGEWRCDNWKEMSHNDRSFSRWRNYWPKGTDQWRDGYVAITLDTDLQGSTCQLVQKGIKEVPIFEVVCQEP